MILPTLAAKVRQRMYVHMPNHSTANFAFALRRRTHHHRLVAEKMPLGRGAGVTMSPTAGTRVVKGLTRSLDLPCSLLQDQRGHASNSKAHSLARFPLGVVYPVPSDGTEIRTIDPKRLDVSCPVLEGSVCGPPSPIAQNRSCEEAACVRA